MTLLYHLISLTRKLKRTKPRDIAMERPNDIVLKLFETDISIMPKNRLNFWHEIPTTLCKEEEHYDVQILNCFSVQNKSFC